MLEKVSQDTSKPDINKQHQISCCIEVLRLTPQ